MDAPRSSRRQSLTIHGLATSLMRLRLTSSLEAPVALRKLRSTRLARHIAGADRAPGALPPLAQEPGPRPEDHERIVGLADRPHPGLVLELLPVGEQDPARERIDQP